jgi:glycosyltransferase involved in cell wall biosynthesis
VRFIPNGIDIQQVNPNMAETEKDRFLYIGRLIERKHPELIVELAKRCSDMEFVIRGDGPLLEKIKSSATWNIEFIYTDTMVKRVFIIDCSNLCISNRRSQNGCA